MIIPRPANSEFDDEDRDNQDSSYSASLIADLQFWIDHPSLDDLTAAQTESERQQVRRDIDDCIRLLSVSTNRLGQKDDVDELDLTKNLGPQQRYKVLKLLGTGAFGVVLHVRDSILNREVAIKVLRPSVLLSKQARTRFSMEGEALARCNCEGVVPIHEVGQIDGNPYIVMGLIQGMTLAEYIKGLDSPFAAQMAARIVAAIADTVHRAHQRGILHRDLKPSNVLLDHNEGSRSGLPFNLFVSDFGLAKDLLPNSGEFQGDGSTDSSIIGTVRYMSPEQATGQHAEISTTSDVFSLGVILYELLTLECPFNGTTTFEIIHQVATASAKSPRQLNPKVSRDLSAIVGRCLAKRPNERYQSASELSEDLNRFLVGKPVVAKPAGPIKATLFWVKRNPSLAVASMAIWCGLLVGTIAISYLYRLACEASIRAEAARSFALTSADEMLRFMAEKTLQNVPQTSQKKLDLHLESLAKNEEYAELRGHDEESRYRLSISHHYVANDAFNCQQFELASFHRSRCLEIVGELAKEDPKNNNYQFDIFMNRFLTQNSRFSSKEYLVWLVKTREHLQSAIRLSPYNPDYEEADAAICVKIGHIMYECDQGNPREMFSIAIEKLPKLGQMYPERPHYYKHAIAGHQGMARVGIKELEWESIRQHCVQALDMIEKHFRKSGDVADILVHKLTTLEYYTLALGHIDKGRAIEVYDQYIAESFEIEKLEKRFGFYRMRRAGALLGKAKLYCELGNLANSKTALAEAKHTLENYKPALASDWDELSVIEVGISELTKLLEAGLSQTIP